MRRMRTATGVMSIIMAGDPDTAITLRYIRRLISNGEVPVTIVGSKKLVDADVIIEYIANGNTPEEPRINGIRQVPA